MFEIEAFGDKLLKYHEPEDFGVRRGFFSEHAALDVNPVRCDQHLPPLGPPLPGPITSLVAWVARFI